MRVLHVIPSLSGADGGPTEALLLMERALAALAVVTETATTDDDGPGRRNGKATGQPLPENGATHWYFPKLVDLYKPAPALALWIAHEVRRFDLLHIHGLFSFTTTAAARAARRAGVPYVVRPMGSLNAYGMTGRRPRLKQLSMRLVEGPILRAAAAVHFTSDAEAREAARWQAGLRAVVIPLGVEASAAADASRTATTDQPQALFLSRLDPKKNVEALLHAAALLSPEFPRLRWAIAGGGEPAYVASLHALAATLGLQERIRWLGPVSGAAKARALGESDLFVLPSFSENFGIAAAEALAAGLPCVLGEGVAIAREVAEAGAGAIASPTAHGVAEGVRLQQHLAQRIAAASSARAH
jgi:glycosyltransferase involved in cell wall biosynthesis